MAKGDAKDASKRSDGTKKAGKQEPNAERDTPTKIRDWLDGHGYPLEMKTAKALSRAGYYVQQSTYFENAQGVHQEIDVVAQNAQPWRDPEPGGNLEVRIVAECKANPKMQLPWVVFTADTDPFVRKISYLYGLNSWAGNVFFDLISEREGIVYPELATFGDRTGYGLQCANIRDGVKANEDLAYKAILKLTHAAVSQYQYNAGKSLRVVLPVLMVGTPLYECWLDDAGAIQIEERQHLALAWHRPTQVKATAHVMTVHVVHESGLAEFIQKADQLFAFFWNLRDDVTMAIVHCQKEEKAAEQKRLQEERDASANTLANFVKNHKR
jgi:hypothetical protein